MIQGVEEFINTNINDIKYKEPSFEFEVDGNLLYLFKGDMVYFYDMKDKDDIKEFKNTYKI